MRNLKRALSLTLASIMLLGMMVVGSSAASYQDVTDEHNVEAIEVLQAVGIMVGDEGNFNPEKNVTRNEMAVIMSNLMDYRVASYSGTSPFTDVPAWAEPYVAACYTNGITSGTSATTYNGSGNVTTAQAALMVMKALGYFQSAADFKDDWQLETTRQANRIDLLVDVKAGVRDAMTRNDVAQLVLNALESGTVEADDSNKVSVTVGEAKVDINGSKYVYVTSSEDYAEAINDARNTNNDGSYSTGSIVELGEKLYQGDLTKKDDYDAFGRPADIWEYETKEIGTYAKAADYTFTAKVTSKALYNAIGSTVANYPNWTVSVNGDPVDYDGADLRENRTDDDACFLKFTEGDAQTGNGVLTQVYVDGTNNNRTVDIAVIHFYSAEVLRVNKDDETITLSDLDNGPAKADDLFDTTAFEEDEIVVYSYSEKTGDIESVAAAEAMEGEVTRVRINTANNGQYRDGDNFTADGTDYKYSFTMSDEDKLQTEHVNNTVVGYTDSYGYVIYIDESAMTYDYAYVLSMNDFDDQYGDTTWYARLVLTDGTLIRVETDNDENLEGRLVSYSKDKNNVYTLADRSGYALASAPGLNVDSGVASVKADSGHSNFVANSNTVFIVAQSETKNNQPDYDNYDFRVYTGIANVPDIDGNSDTKAVVAARNGNVARVIYIEDAKVSGMDDVIFIRADSKAKLEKDSELGNYYVISAVVDGEVVSWKVKELSRAAEKLVTKINNVASDPGKVILAASDVYEDADGLVTNVTLYEAFDGEDGVQRGTITGKHQNSTIGLGNTRYGYNGNDVVVVKYDRWNAFSVERVNSIKDDYNDNWVAVFDGNVVTGVCYQEIPGGEEAPTYYDLTVTGTGAADVTNLTPSAGADKVTTSSTVTFTVPSADYTVNVTGGTATHSGNNYTVTGITGDVIITVTKPATEAGKIDENITLAGDGAKYVTEAHVITSTDDVSAGKYNGMTVGKLYLAVTLPNGATGETSVQLQTVKNGITANLGSGWNVTTTNPNKTNTAPTGAFTLIVPELVASRDYDVMWNAPGLTLGGNTSATAGSSSANLVMKATAGIPTHATSVDVIYKVEGLKTGTVNASATEGTGANAGYYVLTVTTSAGAFSGDVNLYTAATAEGNVTVTIKDVVVKGQNMTVRGAEGITAAAKAGEDLAVTSAKFKVPAIDVTVPSALSNASKVDITFTVKGADSDGTTNFETTRTIEGVAVAAGKATTTTDTAAHYTANGQVIIEVTKVELAEVKAAFVPTGTAAADSAQVDKAIVVAEDGSNAEALTLTIAKAANFADTKKVQVTFIAGATTDAPLVTANAVSGTSTASVTISVPAGTLKNITGGAIVVEIAEVTPS